MKKIFLLTISAILLQCTFSFCQINKKELPQLKGLYLGQTLPGTTPVLFPPAILQADSLWFWHGSPMFSPDLKEMFFVKFDKKQPGTGINWMKYENNQWTAPQPASFTQLNSRENNPFFSGSSDTLYFYNAKSGGGIVFVVRNAGGWSQPAKLPLVLPAGKRWGGQFSIAKKGTIYAELSDGDIYWWKYANGSYSPAEKLSSSINSANYDFTPFIDSAERFILFVSDRPGGFGKNDIYISFRNNDGTWMNAVNMGPLINSAEEEAFPSISHDGKYFIFCREGKSGFNPYWIDIKFIEGLKNRKE